MNNRFSFRGTTVYILSPEKWGTMRVSKHHYALELAKAGAKVYFIEPPDLRNRAVEVLPSHESPALHIVRYKPLFRGRRYLPAVFYNQLIRLQIRKIKRAIGHNPDVVWCFDPSRFRNLHWFRARHSIFFGADLFPDGKVSVEARTADICLGISDTIVQSMQDNVKAPVYFINHGLSKIFAELAENRLTALRNVVASDIPKSVLRIGYVGSLVHEALDRKTMKMVISQHPDLQFVFWGQYERKGNLVAFESEEVFSFIDFLKAQPNVELRGAVLTEQLSREMQDMDLFWLCWDLQKEGVWDGSNSHKVMEYLSTGKPVVSHFMSTYSETELLQMMPDKSNDLYPDCFDKMIQKIKQGEAVEDSSARIMFALENTYKHHISRIEEIISGSS